MPRPSKPIAERRRADGSITLFIRYGAIRITLPKIGPDGQPVRHRGRNLALVKGNFTDSEKLQSHQWALGELQRKIEELQQKNPETSKDMQNGEEWSHWKDRLLEIYPLNLDLLCLLYSKHKAFEWKAQGDQGVKISASTLKERTRPLALSCSIKSANGCVSGDATVGKVSTKGAQVILDRIAEQKGAPTSNRTRAHLIVMFDWEKRELGDDFITNNPFKGTRKASEKGTKKPNHSWPVDVLEDFVAWCLSRNLHNDVMIGHAARLASLTGQRIGDGIRLPMPDNKGNISLFAEKTGKLTALPAELMPGLSEF